LDRRDKKSIEKLHFEYFKECCKKLPSCIHIEHSDKPDFLCTHSGGVLGIEHRRLFKEARARHPNAPQALESFRQQIVESAQKRCEKDIPPLFVQVWFNFRQVKPKNKKKEIERISSALAEFVKKWHEENPSKFYESFKSPSDILPVFRMFITHAWNGKTGLPYHLWVVEDTAVVQNLTTEKIQSRINEKNHRYEEYLKKCDECWLLVVVDVFKDSQSFEISDKILNHKFESKFERVFYMDASHRKDLWELNIKRLKAFP